LLIALYYKQAALLKHLYIAIDSFEGFQYPGCGVMDVPPSQFAFAGHY
jgi:hypothetical protein